MKPILSILALFLLVTFSIDLNAQKLNQEESDLLNNLFEKQRKDFDFQGKMVAYTSGTSGVQIEDKSTFFDKYIENATHGNVSSMLILTKEENKKSGGFDIVLMSPVKLFTTKHREILIGELKKLSKSYAEKSKYEEPENTDLNKVFLVNSVSLFKGYYYQGTDYEFHYFISKWDYQKDKLIKLKLTDLNVLNSIRYGIKEVRISLRVSEIEFGNNNSGTLFIQD